jgi:hypothetical protein
MSSPCTVGVNWKVIVGFSRLQTTSVLITQLEFVETTLGAEMNDRKSLKRGNEGLVTNHNLFRLFLADMSAEREQNGPTQVHPALTYTDLSAHMQLNGMNGLNGIGMSNKPFAERGEEQLSLNWLSGRGIYLPNLKLKKFFETLRKIAMENFFTLSSGHARVFLPAFPYLVVFADSSNGSNFTVTRWTPLKFSSLICLATAAMTPPERLKAPLIRIDMFSKSFSRFSQSADECFVMFYAKREFTRPGLLAQLCQFLARF